MPRRAGGPTSATATATETARARLARFARRKETLRKKTGELVALCNVEVAVVCTGPGGVGDLDCWPSRAAVDAVVRRYNALGPTERAKNKEDLADDVAAEVAQEREMLTRARAPDLAGAFGSYDGSLRGMSEEKLRELLASIEGALVAARDRFLKLRAPPGVAARADRATLSPGLVHDREAADEDSASATNNVVPAPQGEADAGGGRLGRPPSGKDPNPPNAVPVDAVEEVVAENIVVGEDPGDEVQQPPSGTPNAVPVDAGEDEVMAENIVVGEDPGDDVQILQPPGDADADDAEWMRSLVDDLKKQPQPSNPAANAAGTEYINVGGSWMERDAYDFIRFDLGMPPPSVAPNYLDFDDDDDDDGEPLKLWSWDNTMPPPPKY